jgi:hypothetical protein
MRVAYFAYGSNMSSARLLARVPGATPRGAARLDGWRLVLDKPSRDGSAKANIEAWSGACVWGVAWSIPEPAWPVLDRYEPGYDRMVCRLLDTSDAVLEAITYVYRGTSTTVAAYDWYVEHLIAGAEEHALPPSYRRGLLALRADAWPEGAGAGTDGTRSGRRG